MSNRSFVVLEFALHATTRRRFPEVFASPVLAGDVPARCHAMEPEP